MASKTKKTNDLKGVQFNITAQPGKQQMAMDNKSDFLLYGGAAGCVDSETEYLSEDGWKKISEYSGGKVAQFNPKNKRLTFCDPYFVEEDNEKDGFYKIENAAGINQCLTMPHRFVFYKKKKSKKHFSMLVGDVIALEQAGHPLSGYVETLDGSRIPFNIKGKPNTKLKIFQHFPEDTNKYCFETETGFLYLRRGSHKFVTGNSGKSRLLLLKALKYIYNDPLFSGVMFRKTTSAHKAAGGLFTEAKKLYRPLQPHIREQAMEIEFSSTGGGSLKFTHLEHETTAEQNFQGKLLAPSGSNACRKTFLIR